MRQTAREREWKWLERQERSFLAKGSGRRAGAVSRLLEEKVPDKLQETLDGAFSKAFELVFEKGTGIIEKTYDREALEHQYQVNSYSADLAENKKTLRKFEKDTGGSHTKNLLFSGASGLGLGALGIGLPDIPLFVGVLLKSLYETAIQFGYDYTQSEEKYFILKIIETALSGGDQLRAGNRAIDRFIEDPKLPEGYAQDQQIRATSSVMAEELLCLKFLQGIPVVGAVGGAYNAVYMQKIQKYARLKYYRRFLYDREADPWMPDDAG